MSDQEPDPGEALSEATPEPQSEPGAESTESFADAAISATPTQSGAGSQEQAELPTDVGNEPEESVGEGEAGQETAAETVVAETVVTESAIVAETVVAETVVAEAVVAEPTAQGASSGGKRSGRRATWAVGLGLGYVVLAAGTAFGVIIDKSPAPVDVTAVNASAYAAPIGTASATASTGASAKSSASASASAAPTTPSASPTPKSTVTGSVSDGVHHGDLRYFLLQPPQGPSSVQGNPDGNTDNLDEAVTAYGGDASQDSILKSYGFKAACDRTFQDSSIGANVSIELIQFKSSSDAEEWTDGFSLSGSGFASILVPGESGAHGWSYAKDGSYTLVGMYREGDTFFEVTVYATQSVPASDLGKLVSGQHSRLANG